MVPNEMRKVVPPKMGKVELRELVVLAEVVLRKPDVREADVRKPDVRGPKSALAGRLGIACIAFFLAFFALGSSIMFPTARVGLSSTMVFSATKRAT